MLEIVGADFVVIRANDAAGAGDCCVEGLAHCVEEGKGCGDFGVVIEGHSGGEVGALYGVECLGAGAGEVSHKFYGGGSVAAVFGDCELPSAEGGGAVAACAGGEGGDLAIACDGGVGAVDEAVGVGPVAHEDGVAGLEHLAGFFFGIHGDARRRNGVDPSGGADEGPAGSGGIDLDLARGRDDGAAVFCGLPFEGVAGEAFVGAALPDESPEVGVAAGAFGILDGGGHGGEFVPGGRGLGVTVFVEKVGSVVEQGEIDIPGDGEEAAIDGVVADDCGREVGGLGGEGVGKIEEMILEHGRPNDVNLIDVDIRRAGTEVLKVLGKALGGTRRTADEADMVSGFGFELADESLGDLENLGAGVSDEGDGCGRGRSGPAGDEGGEGEDAEDDKGQGAGDFALELVGALHGVVVRCGDGGVSTGV